MKNNNKKRIKFLMKRSSMLIKYSGIKKIKFPHMTTRLTKNLSSNKIVKIQGNPLSHRDFNKIG